LSPAIMARYAVGDLDGLRAIAARSVKLFGVALAVPVGLLCGFSRPLLSIWLGPDFVQFDLLLILLVGHLSLNLAIRPLLYVLTAYNKLRFQALLTLAFGFANVALALAFARWTEWGVLGVAAATAIVWTMRNVVLLSAYTAALMEMRWWKFYPPLVAGAVGTLGVALAGRYASQLWQPTNWFSLGLFAAATAAVYCLIAYTLALNPSDRQLLWRIVKTKSSG